jgi:hypothetical protein
LTAATVAARLFKSGCKFCAQLRMRIAREAERACERVTRGNL